MQLTHIAASSSMTPRMEPLPGWAGGVIQYYGGRGGQRSAILVLDRIVGDTGGYAGADAARTAATLLTTGAEHAAVGIAQDADRRYRLYEASLQEPGTTNMALLHFETAMPRTPQGGVLDTTVFNAADGLIEVRDGARMLYPAI